MNNQDMISRSALIEATRNFCDRYEVHWTDNKVLAWIYNAPAVDAVEVVRCASCKYHNKAPCPMRLSFNWTKGNDFCSYGERKGDDATD